MSELWDPAIAENLEAFVLYVYPWGKDNTPLWNQKGPRTWQRDDLQELSDHIRKQRLNEAVGLDLDMWKKAEATGRGTGKSALVSWLSHWFMTCVVGGSTIITANTEPQLKTKTFAEISKWFRLAINSHWFEMATLSVKPAEWFRTALADQLQIDSTYYYIQGLLWSEENPDAFAGAHNMYGLNLIFDEASGIPKKIFDVSEGFFTDLVLHRYWWVFSNPRRNVGGFYDAFHANRKYWRLRQLDSREVEGIDRKRLDAIVEQHGVDSDTTRIEVLGQFPAQGNNQFIANPLVHAAQTRPLPDQADLWAPLILGIDVARFGDDDSVFRFRRGRDARSIPVARLRSMDNMAVANRAAHLIDIYAPDAVCIDAGQGTGVIDRLREMKYKNIYEIWFGSEAEEKEWANKRTEMYARLREWLKGGCVDNDPRLFTDLTVHEYYFFGKAKDQQMLRSKEEIKELIGRSPDDGDALALTFAVKVARKDRNAMRGGVFDKSNRKARVMDGVDYEVFS